MKKKIIISVILLLLVIPCIVFGDALNYQKTQITTGGKDASPAWSPNGGKIAFASTRSGNYDIWVVNPDGTGLSSLTSDSLAEKYPSWSPDSSKIAYIVFNPNSGTSGGYYLYTMNADGSGKTLHPLPPGSGQELTDNFWKFEIKYTAWSADGQKIAFVSYGPDGGSFKIYTYNLNNNQVTNISPEVDPFGDIYKISWCGANNLLAYDRWPFGIQTFTPGGSDYRVLDIPRDGHMDTPGMPGWNPAGTKVAYIKNVYRSASEGGSILGIFDPASGLNLQEAAPENFKWPVWNNDGQKIAVIKGDFMGDGTMGDIWILTLAAQQSLYADFAGYGLYQYDGTNWSPINTVNPEVMTASGGTLYADFTNYGLYKYAGGTWTEINKVHPANMLSSGGKLFATFTGYGLYLYDGTNWSPINSVNPDVMTASGGTLYADFANYGLYKYTGGAWTEINKVRPTNMLSSDGKLYATFTGYGLYLYDGTNWSPINVVNPDKMTVSGGVLYADFVNYGLYKYAGGAWTEINKVRPTNMLSSGGKLYATFTGYGFYQYDNATGWKLINSVNPDSMTVSGGILYPVFNGYGFYKYDGATWTQINSVIPNKVVAGE